MRERESANAHKMQRQMDLSCIMQSLGTMQFQHALACSLRFQFHCLWLIDTHSTQKQTSGFSFCKSVFLCRRLPPTPSSSTPSSSPSSVAATFARDAQRIRLDLNFDGNRQQKPKCLHLKDENQLKRNSLLIQSIENPNGHSLFAFHHRPLSLSRSLTRFRTHSLSVQLPFLHSFPLFLCISSALLPIIHI